MITANGLIKLGFEPEVDFKAQDDGNGAYIKEWLSDQPQPSEAEIETADAQAQAEYDSKQYARARATEYSALNQFEMQFDDQQNNTTTWVDAINDIKARFPK